MTRRTLARLFAGTALSALAVFAVRAKLNADTLAVRQPAPAYALVDQSGKLHTSQQDRGHLVLLAFYPADFTGGCTLEAHALTAAYPDLKALGVRVYGVSVQDAKSHAGFCSKEGIPYPLLADTDRKAAKAYGVLIPGANIANRVTYILGPDGRVLYVDSDVNGHLATCGKDWAQWIKAHAR